MIKLGSVMNELVGNNRVGLITIRDIMQPSGLIKSELTLRAEITKNARVRTVPMPEGLLTKHIELYLAHRIENNIGVIPKKTEDFRGLSPDLPVIFSGRGSGFAMARKVRVLESGETEIYTAADALEQLFRDIYYKGGMIGASSHSGPYCSDWNIIFSGSKTHIERDALFFRHVIYNYSMSYYNKLH